MSDLPLRSRARELAARLNEARAYRRGSAEDDVQDPINQSEQVHRDVAAHIAGCLQPLAQHLFAPVPVATSVEGHPTTSAYGIRALPRALPRL